MPGFEREVAKLEKRHESRLIIPSEERGRRQGKLEGKLEGRLEMLRALLVGRFGELPAELDRALAAVQDPRLLDRLAVQALTAGSAQEIAALLEEEGGRNPGG